jgi:hypothetical protein
MNTRKYPRTMDQAFPFGPQYACALERPSRHEATMGVLLAVVIGIALALALVSWWSA